jgi:hypothetical protein
VVQQQVKGHYGEDKEDGIREVSDDPQAEEPGVRDNVPSRGPRVTGNVQLGIYKAFGKAARDADEKVKDARDSRESLW